MCRHSNICRRGYRGHPEARQSWVMERLRRQLDRVECWAESPQNKFDQVESWNMSPQNSLIEPSAGSVSTEAWLRWVLVSWRTPLWEILGRNDYKRNFMFILDNKIVWNSLYLILSLVIYFSESETCLWWMWTLKSHNLRKNIVLRYCPCSKIVAWKINI